MRIEVKKGSNMKPEVLNQLEKIWQLAFNPPYDPESHDEVGEDYEKNIFFVLYDKGKILSVALLNPVRDLKFMGKSYETYGIGGVVSVIKGKGYGKRIMVAMRRYLSKNKKMGIGFCKAYNDEFYRKCGYGIVKGLVKNFRFKSKRGKIVEDKFDDNVIFFPLKNKLLEKMINNSKEKAFAQQKPW